MPRGRLFQAHPPRPSPPPRLPRPRRAAAAELGLGVVVPPTQQACGSTSGAGAAKPGRCPDGGGVDGFEDVKRRVVNSCIFLLCNMSASSIEPAKFDRNVAQLEDPGTIQCATMSSN